MFKPSTEDEKQKSLPISSSGSSVIDMEMEND